MGSYSKNYCQRKPICPFSTTFSAVHFDADVDIEAKLIANANRWDAVQRKLGKDERSAPPAPPQNTELVLSGKVKRAVLEEYNQANQNHTYLHMNSKTLLRPDLT